MKAKWGMIVVAGSGKIGGHVASRNRGGSYFRTKVTPLNPQTSFQTEVRNRMTELSQAWKDLTEAQRAAWNGAVENFARTDVFGDLRNPSGFNLYQRLNNNLLQTGAAAIDVPPVPEDVPVVIAGALTIAVTGAVFTLALSGAVPAGVAMKVDATPPLSPGVSFAKNQFRTISYEAAAVASPVDLQAAYVAKYGAPVEGQKIFVRISFINITTGQNSAQQVVSDIVAA